MLRISENYIACWLSRRCKRRFRIDEKHAGDKPLGEGFQRSKYSTCPHTVVYSDRKRTLSHGEVFVFLFPCSAVQPLKTP